MDRTGLQLFLIRHAEATSVALSDDQRGLTPRGRASFEASVRGLATLDVGFDRILHSPLLRAVQTAELCAPLLHGESAACEELALAPGERLLGRLRGDVDARVALVGHEPWMGELCARLVTGDPSLAGGLRFKKGGVAWLRGEPRWQGMELCGFLPPEVTRALGEPR